MVTTPTPEVHRIEVSIPRSLPERCLFCDRGAVEIDPAWSSEVQTVVRCRNCEVRVVWPLPSPELIARIYTKTAFTDRVYPSRIRGHSARSDWLRQILSLAESNGVERGRLLDVGCSEGDLLEVAQAAGWEVEGVEPDRETAEDVAKRLKVPVHRGMAPEALNDLGRYDLLVLNNVLEHSLDPFAVLSSLAQHLSVRGGVVVTLPNAASWIARFARYRWSWFCPPIHLWYPTPKSLQVAAERAGLQLRESKTLRGDANPPIVELAIVLAKEMRRLRADPTEQTGGVVSAMPRSVQEILGWVDALSGDRRHGQDQILAFLAAP
jgi:2-polyprenyl-3-methyl-5-hydroxy-6-metoxy-1,4-benzoquinol methylase